MIGYLKRGHFGCIYKGLRIPQQDWGPAGTHTFEYNLDPLNPTCRYQKSPLTAFQMTVDIGCISAKQNRCNSKGGESVATSVRL